MASAAHNRQGSKSHSHPHIQRRIRTDDSAMDVARLDVTNGTWFWQRCARVSQCHR